MNIFLQNNYQKGDLEKGFMLHEMLLSLTISIVIVFLLSFPLQIILNQELTERELYNMEWETFLLQLKKETRMVDTIKVENNKLLLYVDGSVVSYEKYGTNIRRRVDATGHEIALQHVMDVDFSNLKNGFHIQVVNLYGEEKESDVHSYLNLEDW